MRGTKSGAKARRFGQKYRYDVVLSFAGEDRPYVERVPEELRLRAFEFFIQIRAGRAMGKGIYMYT